MYGFYHNSQQTCQMTFPRVPYINLIDDYVKMKLSDSLASICSSETPHPTQGRFKGTDECNLCALYSGSFRYECFTFQLYINIITVILKFVELPYSLGIKVMFFYPCCCGEC